MRTIRDLREIINVSRLNYNYDDDDESNNYILSGSDNESTTPPVTKTTTNKLNNGSTKSSTLPKPISSNKIPVSKNPTSATRTLTTSSREYALLNRTSIPRTSINNSKSIILDDTKTNKSISLTRSISKFDEIHLNDDDDDITKDKDILIVEGNFDQMLTYIDTSIVSEWLNRANKSLHDMYTWLEASKCESFIHFSNFWLTKLNDKQRRELIQMEYSIIVEEISQAFLVGIESEKLTHKDVGLLLKAVFKEYPLALLSFRGLYLLLDYIDILCSDRRDEYKKLLSDVKCRTLNKQYAQWLLSARSFALINLCFAAVKFFQNATAEPTVEAILRAKSAPVAKASSKKPILQPSARASSPLISTTIEVKYKYYRDTVFKNDYAEVLHYLILTKKCDPLQKDEHNRTFIFLAVMHNQPKILNYLIKRWPKIDINEPCDSGNTPLHAAVNMGKLENVEILLKSKTINVNLLNKSCMNASALHLAVWHGYDEIAITLIRNKSDPYLRMSIDRNAFEMARDNDNQVLAELLEEFYNEDKNVRESIAAASSKLTSSNVDKK